MRETIHTFDPEGSLVGVLTEAEGPARRAGVPLLLILNAGFVHKVGPYRMHVDLARTLVELGFDVMRLDLSGIGDSGARTGNLSAEERVMSNIRAALDSFAATRRLRSCVLLGICSGAKNSHNVAVSDPRIRGVVLLDGFAFRTPAYHFWYYAKRAFQIGRWKNFLRVRGNALRARLRGQQAFVHPEDQWQLPLPSPAEYEDGLRCLVERGVKMLYVYTGGTGHYSYRNQFRDAFKTLDFRDSLQLEFFEKTDHTYTLMRDRDRLFGIIRLWLDRHFSGEAV